LKTQHDRPNDGRGRMRHVSERGGACLSQKSAEDLRDY
jgi:hypothetical protein